MIARNDNSDGSAPNIIKNVNSININLVELMHELDPFFVTICSKFDESRSIGLLMNTVDINSKVELLIGDSTQYKDS